MIHRPKWFLDGKVMVSTASTCGLTKGGRPLPLIDKTTGSRIKVIDPETNELTDQINDELLGDMIALSEGRTTDTLRFVDESSVSLRAAVPVYYDKRYDVAFKKAMKSDQFDGFTPKTLGELVSLGELVILGGHGSPSNDQRVGEVPYIKVSDLRAGLVNINPTNRVPHKVAESFWGGPSSGLQPYDILSPERTSKNIGDFCLLLPGQEMVLLTKEIIVIRPGENANFDSFYLLWAMTLKIVREQWKRVVFMQTNREDVGDRFLEISIPVPLSRQIGKKVARPFSDYYRSLATARMSFADYLSKNKAHHFFVSGAEPPDLADIVLDDVDSHATINSG